MVKKGGGESSQCYKVLVLKLRGLAFYFAQPKSRAVCAYLKHWFFALMYPKVSVWSLYTLFDTAVVQTSWLYTLF